MNKKEYITPELLIEEIESMEHLLGFSQEDTETDDQLSKKGNLDLDDDTPSSDFDWGESPF